MAQKLINPSTYGASDVAPDTGESRKIIIDDNKGFKKDPQRLIIGLQFKILHYDSDFNETGRRLKFWIWGRNSERVNSSGQRLSRWELNPDGSFKLDENGDKIWNTNWDNGINEHDYVMSLLDTNPDTQDSIIIYYAEQFLAQHIQANGIDYLYNVMNQEYNVDLKSLLVNS